MSIYTIIFVAFLTVAAYSNSADPGSDRHEGAQAAVRFAANEIRRVDESLELPNDGYFRRLAAKNPSLWLIAREGDRSFSLGRPPRAAVSFVEQYGDVVQSARFLIPNAEGPLRAASMRRYDFSTKPLVVAAGGVDPATLTSRDSLHLFGPDDALIALVVIALLGFLPMLVALPFFSRAIRPITAEAAMLLPQNPDRRLDERKAPREVLPLVRGFNAALDRLAIELGRRRRFITDAAHELRTPLAVIALRVEALEDDSAKRELRRGLERLVHIVSQMLDAERLSLSGRERSLVDLVAVARDVVADLAPTAIEAGHDLSLEAPDSPVTVSGDAHAISRAITNLITNSVAHSGAAGQISVVVSADRTIDVIDDGPGVPAALQPRLFEPFSRGSQNIEGCGLGLHLTREIMRAHGGDVCLVPSRRGATFRLGFTSPADEG